VTGRAETIRNTGVVDRTQTGKGNATRTLCQKNQGTFETNQEPVMVDDRTTYGALSLERTPLQDGTDGQSH
jgi:hypothetical protein